MSDRPAPARTRTSLKALKEVASGTAPAARPSTGPVHSRVEAALPQVQTSDRRKVHRIDRFLALMNDRGASDFHLHVGGPPYFRLRGEMVPLRYRVLMQHDFVAMVQPITPSAVWAEYENSGDADYAYELPGVARFRVNLMRQERGGGAVFRIIPHKIISLDQLGLPPAVARIAELRGGLVLVIGATGSGKSTTLAALIDRINQKRRAHILTLEDPVEFVYDNAESIVHQREVGAQARTFADGLRAAVREDPDLLLVGEMRDRETIALALEAAEKGLLVFGTLHANNTYQCIDRMIGVFPENEQDGVRAILADTLRAVLAQQLLKKIGGGRVAAFELLFGSPALANLIREGKTHQVISYIQTHRREGMMAMDDSLKGLFEEGKISREDALERAIDKELFKEGVIAPAPPAPEGPRTPARATGPQAELRPPTPPDLKRAASTGQFRIAGAPGAAPASTPGPGDARRSTAPFGSRTPPPVPAGAPPRPQPPAPARAAQPVRSADLPPGDPRRTTAPLPHRPADHLRPDAPRPGTGKIPTR